MRWQTGADFSCRMNLGHTLRPAIHELKALPKLVMKRTTGAIKFSPLGTAYTVKFRHCPVGPKAITARVRHQSFDCRHFPGSSAILAS